MILYILKFFNTFYFIQSFPKLAKSLKIVLKIFPLYFFLYSCSYIFLILNEINGRLKEMKGFEYEIHKALPPWLFIIHKLNRLSPSKSKRLLVFSFHLQFFSALIENSYYVLDGAIYQSPSLNTLISHRLVIY
jgi:hypothetical protein